MDLQIHCIASTFAVSVASAVEFKQAIVAVVTIEIAMQASQQWTAACETNLFLSVQCIDVERHNQNELHSDCIQM